MAMRNAGKLHPASKKYLLWAILLMVLSVTTYAIGPDVFLKANEGNHGADGEIIGSALSIVRVGCQWIGHSRGRGAHRSRRRHPGSRAEGIRDGGRPGLHRSVTCRSMIRTDRG